MRAFATGRRSVSCSLLFLLFAGDAAANMVTYTGDGGPFNVAYFASGCPTNAYGGNVCVGMTTYTISVSDTYLINAGNAVTVNLTGLQYPYASDLEVSLSLEDGAGNVIVPPIDLFNQIGGAGADPAQFGNSSSIDSGDYAFNSAFAGDLWATADGLGSSDSIPSGEYFTTDVNGNNDQLSSAFSGLPVTGIWALTVTDYCPPFSDCVSQQNTYQFPPGITSWSLTVGTPEPSTLIPTALSAGLLLLGIRGGVVRGRR
jgi:hypothetical protein